MVAHTFNLSTWESQAFNPSSREMETGKVYSWEGEEYKAGGREELKPLSQAIQSGIQSEDS